MAGHSKWANIKHRKGAQDKRRAKVFTRCIREITLAARDGNPDPESNPALRLAIQNAKGANIPKDTIERAIQKGKGGEAQGLTPLTYEGYAPGGVGIILAVYTDNINRTIANIRTIFNKFGGNLSTNGSLDFVFSTKGVFEIPTSQFIDKDKSAIELALIDGGAEDLEFSEEGILIYTSFTDFGLMNKTLEGLQLEPANAEIRRIPANTVTLPVDEAKQIFKMIDRFEEDDDISTVYHNLELTEALEAALNAQL